MLNHALTLNFFHLDFIILVKNNYKRNKSDMKINMASVQHTIIDYRIAVVI